LVETPTPRPAILQLCAVDFTARHFLLPLMRAQRAAGFDVHLACAPGEYVAGIIEEGFPVYPIPFERSFNLLAHARAYRRLVRLFKAHRFTVMHAHTPIAAMIARPAARRCGIPLVLYTAHGFYFHEGMRPQVRAAHVWLEKTAQRFADYLFTQSTEDLETAVLEGIAPEGRAMAIGNGVDVEKFHRENWRPDELQRLRDEFGLTLTDGPLVIMIGRLVREKGYFEFLEALSILKRHFPRLRALLIGDALRSDHDDSARAIRQESRDLGLEDKVIFTGLRSDVSRLLALGDIFCLPSWREGMPRSVIEAMAAGLPVVASSIRGCREEVLDGKTGYLVPVRDGQALARALGRLAGDETLRQEMGEAGRRRADEYFSEQRVIQRQMDCLRRLFGEKKLPWPRPRQAALI
jgi:glycosyltransferase involved in cell wall biosynthesis